MTMTPSLSLNRDQLIGLALGKFRANPLGQTLSADELAQAVSVLNLAVSEMRGNGLQLWKREMNYLFPIGSQEKYPISDTAASEWTSTYYSRSLSASAAAGAATITVDSITNATTGDRIGVILDDGTRHWTTINGAPSGLIITLTAVLPSAAASGNKAFNYTTKAYAPLRVQNDGAFRRNTSNQDVLVSAMSFSDYQNQPNKQSNGSVTQVMYDYKLGTGYLYLWPRPTDSRDVIGVSCEMPFLQFSAATDTPDFPQEFYMALIDALAAKLYPYYKSNLQERLTLQAEARTSMTLALDYRQEQTSVFFQPVIENE